MKKLITGLLLIPCMAHAEFFSGNMLLQRLRSDDAYDRALGLGYVMGVSDAGQSKTHCASSQVTAGQVRDVVRQSLERYPATRDLTADVLISMALMEAFPCPTKKKGSGA
jgi:hypothetical protein